VTAAADVFLSATAPLRPGDAVAALVFSPKGRLLLQHRDDKPEIFFPGHWALFGGAVEAGETDLAAMVRELREEIGIALPPDRFAYFTEFDFDFSYAGEKPLTRRVFYAVHLSGDEVDGATLGEGREMALFTPEQALTRLRLVPYDAMAIWMHAARGRIVR